MKRRAVIFFAACLGLILVTAQTTLVRAQDGSTTDQGGAPPDWIATPITVPAKQLFAPSSGALFAATDDGALQRSDDGGVSWRAVPLGPATQIATVDPTNHTILFATGPTGVYRSTDDAASWSLVLPYSTDNGRVLRALAISPADHMLVYAALVNSSSIADTFWFLRSVDGGATWKVIEHPGPLSLCGWGVRLLQPHPTDQRRVARAAACTAGRDFGVVLRQSTDMGASWSPWFSTIDDVTAVPDHYPSRLVGGSGSAPTLFYLAANRDTRLGGSDLVRSDDDGATWTSVLTYRGGGSPGFAGPDNDPTAPDVSLGGLAYDPMNPDRVFVGLAGDGSGVITTPDGGATWCGLGNQPIGAVRDLVLGVDGRNLYAATDTGVWRFEINAGPLPDCALDSVA
jgi:photosystem II stability/assembly factor-like uncharacterized protein